MLPDTAYESAGRVSVAIEHIGSASGLIDNLRSAYSAVGGSLTFRGGPERDAAFGGTVSGTPSEISVDWTFNTDEDMRETSVGRWGGGTGWTGQPILVNWPDSMRRVIASAPGTLPEFDGEELIFGSLASKVYFVDYKTGRATRKAIDVRNPIKGSLSLDPTMNGNLYVGQGVPAERPFGALVIDVLSNKISQTIGEDDKAKRNWGAFDSSAIRIGQFLFWPGENGRLYKYLVERGHITLHTVATVESNGKSPGMESSMAVYRNYGYVSDNAGNLICFNLNTLKPVWSYDLGDDSDASPLLCVEDGKAYVYGASEIDLQGEGTARFAKLDALIGKPVWERKIPGRRHDIGGKHFDGGFYASPLSGTGNCKGLIIANCVPNTDGQNGVTMAFDRKTGKTVWQTKLKRYAWSSPVSFVNEKGTMYV